MSDDFVNEFSHEFRLINISFERGAKPIGMIKAIISLYKIFKKENFAIIQYATPNASFYASIAGFFNKVPARIYCQWGIRYVGFTGITRRLFKTIEILTCLMSTHVRPASKKNMMFAISENHYKKEKAKVIGDGGAVGIDLKQFDISQKEDYKAELLSKYPNLKSKFIYGFVGRLDKDKGVNELLEAFNRIREKNKKTALLIIGANDKISSINKELLRTSQLCEDIIFTGYTNQVAKYLSLLNVLVHPSYREGFSLVIQQAMAMGVPVITTNIPGPSEVIEENISGLLVPSKDSSALYEAMVYVISNDETKLFAQNGLKRVKQLFTQERMSRLIVKDRHQIWESIEK
jgi:glycosyltransferase involved in cell wall biosynthesis